MTWTQEQVNAHNLKFAPKCSVSNHAPAERETGKTGLQKQIMDWCDSQWPKWVYDFPRTDLKSTLPLGRHDATIWAKFPKCYLIETKAKGGKRTKEQQIWAARLRHLGWEVELVYSLEQFLALVENKAGQVV